MRAVVRCWNLRIHADENTRRCRVLPRWRFAARFRGYLRWTPMFSRRCRVAGPRLRGSGTAACALSALRLSLVWLSSAFALWPCLSCLSCRPWGDSFFWRSPLHFAASATSGRLWPWAPASVPRPTITDISHLTSARLQSRASRTRVKLCRRVPVASANRARFVHLDPGACLGLAVASRSAAFAAFCRAADTPYLSNRNLDKAFARTPAYALITRRS